MAEYIVNTDDGTNVASVEYDITIEPVMRINLVTATFNKDRATEIVRCRDCKHANIRKGIVHSCDHPALFAKDEVLWIRPDGFCAWGERRNEDE